MLLDVAKLSQKKIPKKCIQYFIRPMDLNYSGLDLFFPLKL